MLVTKKHSSLDNQLLAFSPPTDIITWEMDGNYFLQQWKEKSIQPLQLFIVTIDDDVC